MRAPSTAWLTSLFLLALALTRPGAAQGVALPYFESFESASWPGPEWTLAMSAPAFGRILAVVPTPASPDGGKAASFDVGTAGTFSTNTLTISVDLAATPTAVLKYWAKETSDETDFEDGLFLNDGVSATWAKVVDHATLTSSWTEITIDLMALAAANGLAVTADFRIRFSQRDNFPVPTDGMQIDGVRILAPPTGQANSVAASLDLNGGLNGFAQTSAAGNAGPFEATATPGGLLTFTLAGPPNVPWILAAGPLSANNVIFPGVGSLDVGELGPGDLSDIAIVLDGTAAGFLNSLAKFDATGASVLTFTCPALPPGPWLAFQAAVVDGATITLTAATRLSVP